MRGGDEVLGAEKDIVLGRLFHEDVKGRAADVAGVETGAKSGFVHQTATGAVDDHHALLGLGQGVGRQDVAGLVGEGGMQGDDVSPGQQVFQLDLFHADFHGPLGREEGVIGDHLHLQAIGPVGDNAADIAGADQAQGLGVELDTHEAVLLPLAGLGRLIGGGQLAGQGEHHGDGVFSGGDGIAEGGVHDHDPLRSRSRNVDIVHADAGPADDLQIDAGGQDILVSLGGRADGQTVIVADDLQQFFLGQAGLHIGFDAALLEDVDGGGRELVGNEYAGHG